MNPLPIGNHRSAPTRAHTLVATKSVTIVHADGPEETIRAGRDRIDARHEWVREIPEAEWADEVQDPPQTPEAKRAQRHRQPRRQMSPEQELRIRRDRLAELNRRAGPPAPTGKDAFWRGVEDLLRDPGLEAEVRESERLLDWLDRGRADGMRAERLALIEGLLDGGET